LKANESVNSTININNVTSDNIPFNANKMIKENETQKLNDQTILNDTITSEKSVKIKNEDNE